MGYDVDCVCVSDFQHNDIMRAAQEYIGSVRAVPASACLGTTDGPTRPVLTGCSSRPPRPSNPTQLPVRTDVTVSVNEASTVDPTHSGSPERRNPRPLASLTDISGVVSDVVSEEMRIESTGGPASSATADGCGSRRPLSTRVESDAVIL